QASISLVVRELEVQHLADRRPRPALCANRVAGKPRLVEQVLEPPAREAPVVVRHLVRGPRSGTREDEPATRAEHAADLAQRGTRVDDVLEHLRAEDAVEGAIAER